MICGKYNEVRDEIVKKVGLLFLILLLIPVTCFAWRATPKSSGLIVNDNVAVVAVNINGPAYVAGIRPGDVIKDAVINGNHINIKDFVEENDDVIIKVTYIRNEEIRSSEIKQTKVLDPATKSMFLVSGNSKDNYERIIRALNFNPKLAALFPIQSTDNNLKMIRTYSNVARKTVDEMADYVVSPGGNGFGLTALETIGNVAVADSESESCSIVKINLGFRAEWSHMFGQTWGNFDSSGILEKKIIRCMFEKI